MLQGDHDEVIENLNMSVLKLGEWKSIWNHSPSFLMSKQQQWGVSLISVTCLYTFHLIHYGHITHLSSANGIA